MQSAPAIGAEGLPLNLRDHRLAKGEWWDSIQYAILSTDSSIEA